MNSIRSVPASSALTDWSHNVCNCHLFGSGKRNGEERNEEHGRTKETFGRNIMQALELHTAGGKKVHLEMKQCWYVKKQACS